MAKAAENTPEARASKRAKNFTDLMWHATVYVIVNVFMWLIAPGAAFWVAVPWGVGLAFHVAAYVLDERGGQNRRYQRYLAEERKRENEGSV